MRIILNKEGEPVADHEALPLCHLAIAEGSDLHVANYCVVQAMQNILAFQEAPFDHVELEAYGKPYIINTYGAVHEVAGTEDWLGTYDADIGLQLATQAMIHVSRRRSRKRVDQR